MGSVVVEAHPPSCTNPCFFLLGPPPQLFHLVRRIFEGAYVLAAIESGYAHAPDDLAHSLPGDPETGANLDKS